MIRSSLEMRIEFNRNRVTYYVPASGNAVIALYDIRGRLVHTLVHGYNETGNHTVMIPAGVATGRYIVSYKCTGQSISRSIAVLR